MKYILAIETTGAFASVALAKAEFSGGSVTAFEVISRIEGHDRFSHLQNLTPQIQHVLQENGSSMNEVSAIAVSAGPGSFTGIRIGVSTARALSQVLGIPCVAVPSLEAMALRQKQEAGTDIALICPIIDARRSQVYGGGFCMTQSGEKVEERFLTEAIPQGPYTVDEFVEAIAASDMRRVLFMGDGIDKYQEMIEGLKDVYGLDCRFEYAPEEYRYQDAEPVAVLGARLAAAGKTCRFDELQPEYMRQAEAERKLKEKQNHG